ncbi:MAG TPA: type I-E CRISPR-associated protein Cas5/CasD [Geobacteraceae bacterium]
MNGVLLIPCVGPMQSWGTRSRFQERDTEREPSKSGVIGMLCAALGRDRSEPVDDLAALRMGVRIEREGKLEKDFQTAQDVAVAGGNTTQNLLSNRYYLADAAFLVGLEGPSELLKSLHDALVRPKWPLFLGRKSYVPSDPFFLTDGLQDNVTLQDALLGFRFLITQEELQHRLDAVKKGRVDKIRFVVEADAVTHEVRNDQPKSFALGQREFRQRYVATSYLDIVEFKAAREGMQCT